MGATAKPRRGERATASGDVRPAPTSPRGLAALADPVQLGDAAREGNVFEPKLDGIRLLAQVEADGVRLWTRAANDRASQFPELCEELARALPVGTWLDGEMIHGSGEAGTRGKVQSAVGSGRPHPNRLACSYAAFDVIALDGADARPLPLSARRSVLERLVERADWERARLVPQFPATAETFQKALDLGFEGVVVKDPSRPYASGIRAWGKVKPLDTRDFVAMGFTDGEGANDGLVGAVRLGLYVDGELTEFAKVGTGFSLDERRYMTAHPEEFDGRVIEVGFNGEMTKNVPQFPRALGWRDDKPPEDCRG